MWRNFWDWWNEYGPGIVFWGGTILVSALTSWLTLKLAG